MSFIALSGTWESDLSINQGSLRECKDDKALPHLSGLISEALPRSAAESFTAEHETRWKINSHHLRPWEFHS